MKRFRRGRTVKYKKEHGYDKAGRNDRNPVDQDGNILRFFRCDSARHRASKYQHKSHQWQDKTSEYNEVHITLFALSPDDWL